MDFVLHDRMSEFVKSTALSPPRRPGDGFDLLDVVVVDPHAKDPAKMLVPTDTNLTKHFSKKRLHRRDRSREVFSSNEQRRSDESFELTDELKSAIGLSHMKGLSASSHASHSSTAHVNLVISHEKTYKVSGSIFSQLEGMVKNNFASIVKNAARFNIKHNRGWYNYYAGGSDVYFLAVITKIYQGSISIEETDSSTRGAGAGAKVSGLWKALTEGHRSESNSFTSSSEGVVGVQLLVFPFRKGEEKGIYSVLDPISIKWMDKHERKRLQRVSRRHSWSLLESKGDGEMHHSRRILADCKASITTYAETSIAYAKQKVKRHDFRRVKLSVAVLLAMLFLVQVLSSLSTTSHIFHVSFVLGPRYVVMVQQALEQALNDFIAYAMKVSFG